MTELTFLGVGAIRPAVPGDHTCLLLQHAGATALLDAGPAIMVQLQHAGVDPAAVSHIYFSHQHGDHILGSPVLLFHRRPRAVLAAAPVLDAWRQLLELVYPGFADILATELDYHPLPLAQPQPWPGLPGLTVTQAQVQHAGIPAYALRLDFAPVTGAHPRRGFSIVYSGDTVPIASVQELAKGADLLIHEATYLASRGQHSDDVHTSALDAGAIAQAAGAKCLALVHRLAGDPEHWRQEAAQTYAGPILVPAAGDRLRLPDDLPSQTN